MNPIGRQRTDIVVLLIVVGLIFVVTNTVVDLVYGMVNPTVKLARPHGGDE